MALRVLRVLSVRRVLGVWRVPRLVAAALLAATAVPLAAAAPAVAAVPGIEVVFASSAYDSSTSKSVAVSCPAGKELMGSGGYLSGSTNGDVVLTAIVPGVSTVTAAAREDQDGTAINWLVVAAAVCADSVPGQVIVEAATPVNSTSSKAAVASCPAGTSVTGIGMDISSGQGQVLGSALTPAIDLRSVIASGVEDQDGHSAGWRVRAFALCATAPPGLALTTVISPFNSAAKSVVLNCGASQRILSAGWVLSGTGGQTMPTAGFPNIYWTSVSAVEDDDGYPNGWTLEARGICVTP